MFCCDMIVVSILLNPHHGTAGWFGRCVYVCIAATFLWSNQNVFGRSETFGTPKSISGCFPGRGTQSAEPLKFPSRRVTLPILDLKDVVGLCISTL